MSPFAASMTVVRAGLLSTVQDQGRPGWAHLGVPPSGALDRPAALLANSLVGNPVDAAVLETTLDGVAVRLDRDGVVAVTGAPAGVSVDGRPVGHSRTVRVPAGTLLEVGRATSGVRSYVAVTGGVAVEPVLGSRSTDLLSGLGPPVLANGDVLRLGSAAGDAPEPDDVQGADQTSAEIVLLTVSPGPRADRLATGEWERLTSQVFTVSPSSNRIGLRLEGPTEVRLRDTGELPSEGIVTGAVQLPPGGQPVVFLADHPVTGGYPVVAVVEPDDLAACAQARPGARVRLVT